MKPKWQKLAGLAQEICTLWFQFFGAVFVSKGYHFKNIWVEKNRIFSEIEFLQCIKNDVVVNSNDVIKIAHYALNI